MWINPRLRDQIEQPAPPAESGLNLLTLDRNRGDEQLRIALDEFNGNPYVGIRCWSRDADGRYWPVSGKGLSIRVRELDQVVAALQEARRILDEGYRPGQGRASAGQQSRSTRTDPPARATAPWHGPTSGPADDPERPRFIDKRRRPAPRDVGSTPALPSHRTLPPGQFSEFDE